MSASSSPGDPDTADPVIVVLTPDTATLAESRERAVAERAAKRLAISTRKHQQAKDRQAFGVTLMKIKNYEGAATCFADACSLWHSNPVCHCDLATAYLHLGRFADAEISASTALALDPKLVEARYARGMARKGRELCHDAIIDFETVLKLDPENDAARGALRELRAGTPDGQTEAVADAAGDVDPAALPLIDADKLEVDSGSDTSDAQHTANDVPCLFYNHQGCARGSACAFSHAPDTKSVRDRLGKNVCLYHLLGLCKFDTKCIYSHERAFLDPTRGWWNDEAKVAEMVARVEAQRAEAKEKRERRQAQQADPEAKRGKGRGKGKKGKGRRKAEKEQAAFAAQEGQQRMLAAELEHRMALLASMGMPMGMAMVPPQEMMARQMQELEERMSATNLAFTDYAPPQRTDAVLAPATAPENGDDAGLPY
ncbi:hypothetical protein GGX14DRAFT_466793 [Mycena pura]|uniref:C3H1-type domain-containing protein n=1 Tax=Mycena pura TaxID=153505 RepID=A0AAD6V1P6_9AGAR|nr:hypothetical protein GGX14DRAFT_466793 [Mycena pura]